jgi:hypothetical protein
MEMIRIQSSNIAAIALLNEQLLIKFNKGDVYAYDKAGRAEYQELAVAESAGKYFHANIRNKFTCRKLDHDPFTRD